MVSLRIMLVLHTMRELITGRRQPRHALVRCPRCQHDSRLDLAEVIGYSTRLECIARPGDQLRCEKCDGRLLRRAPAATEVDSMLGKVAYLAKHRSLVMSDLREATSQRAGDSDAHPLFRGRR